MPSPDEKNREPAAPEEPRVPGTEAPSAPEEPDPSGLGDLGAISPAMHWRQAMGIVWEQAWAMCLAYLVLGVVSDLLRRAGFSLGASIQQSLDPLPYFAIRQLGLLEPYLGAVAVGRLTPFWNRAMLAGITIMEILLVATLVGATLIGTWKLVRRSTR